VQGQSQDCGRYNRLHVRDGTQSRAPFAKHHNEIDKIEKHLFAGHVTHPATFFGTKLVDSQGYAYSKKHVNTNGDVIYWRCSNQQKFKCYAKAKTVGDTAEFMDDIKHNHDPPLL